MTTGVGQDLDLILEGIDLGSMAPPRGKLRKPIEYVVLRELNERDFALLQAPPKLGVTTAEVQRMTNRHHSLARLLAEGRSAVECCAITGHSQSRVSILQDDPAFAELIAFYKQQLTTVYLNVHERLATLGISCMEELQERLETNPGEFTARELKEIMESTFNKTVAPDKTVKGGLGSGGGTPVSISINFPASPHAAAPPLARPNQLELTATDDDGDL